MIEGNIKVKVFYLGIYGMDEGKDKELEDFINSEEVSEIISIFPVYETSMETYQLKLPLRIPSGKKRKGKLDFYGAELPVSAFSSNLVVIYKSNPKKYSSESKESSKGIQPMEGDEW